MAEPNYPLGQRPIGSSQKALENFRQGTAGKERRKIYPILKRTPQPTPDTRPPVKQMEDAANEWVAKVYPSQFADPNVHDRFVNKVLGPGGEELPYSAIGWGPDGEPLWNIENPIVNAWQRFYYNTFEKPVSVSLNTPEGEPRPWWNAIEDTTQGDQPEIKPGQQAPSFLTKMVRGSGEILKTIGDMFNDLFEEPVLRGPASLYLNTIDKVASYSDAPAQQDYTQNDIELENRIANLPDWAQNMARWVNNSRKKSIGEASGYALIRAWDAILDGKIKPDDLKDIAGAAVDPEAFLAGQLLGTSVVDNSARKQFMDRVKNGENPELVWREMWNPWAELSVSLLAPGPGDIPLFGKAWKTLTKWARTPKIGSAAEAAASVRLAPDIENALAAVPQINTNVQAGRAVDNLQDIVTTAVNKIIKDFDETAALPTVTKGPIPIVPVRGLNAPTAGHQINATARIVGRTLRQMMNTDHPEKIVEAVNSLYKLGSGKADDIFEVLSDISHNPAARSLLTEDGMRTAVVVRKMIGDDPAAFIRGVSTAAKGGAADLAKYMDDHMAGAIKAMYPTVTKRIKDWDDAVKAAVAAGKPEPPPPLPRWQMAIDRVHQAAQKTVYGPAAAFMNNFFLKLNPAFGVRNFAQGLFHNLVDYGVGSISRTRKMAERTITEYGVPYKASGLGGGTLGLKGGENVGGFIERALDFLGPLNPTRWADKGEKTLATQVGAASIIDSMEKMLTVGAAIPRTDDLIAAGLNPAAADAMASLIKANKGDTAKAFEQFSEMFKKGEIDLVLSGQWLTPDEITELRKVLPSSADEIISGIADVRRKGGSYDDASKILMDARDNYAASTRRLTPTLPEPDDPDYEAIGRTLDAAPILGDAIKEPDILKLNYYGRVNVAAKSAYTQLFDDVMRGLRTPEIVRDTVNFVDNAKAVTQQYAAKINDLQAQLRGVLDRSFRSDFNIGDEWIKLPWPDGNNRINDIPKDLPTFRNRLWEELWYPMTKELWKQEREGFFTDAEKFIDTHGAAIRNLPQYQTATQYRALSQLWDAVLVPQMYRRNLALAIETGDNAAAARILANAFGISTATEAGVPMRSSNLLKVINENLRPGWPAYKNINDVEPSEALYAMQNRLYKESGLASAYGPAGLIRSDPTIPEKMANLTSKNLGEIPKGILNEIKKAAEEMLSELLTGQNGFRLFNWTPSGLEVSGVGTTNAMWYRIAYNDRNITNRDRFAKVLEDIITPTDNKHDSREWRYVMEVIQDRIYRGYETQAGPVSPNIKALIQAGDELGALEGWDEYAKILRKSFGETEEGIEQALRTTAGDYYNRFVELRRMRDAGVEPRVITGTKVDDVLSQMMGHQPAAAGKVEAAAETFEDIANKVDDRVVAPPPIARSFDATHTPTPNEAATATLPDMEKLLNRTAMRLKQSWGVTKQVFGDAQQATDKVGDAIKAYIAEADGRISVARNAAARVADKAREFTVLNYGDEYGFDLVAKYIFPYQFWYSRSYMNWMKRIAANPKLIGNYQRYRNAMAAEHAGMPEWWRYNVSTRDAGKALGIDVDNPLYFNIESLLNPLNGMVGTDFNDPERRVNWWTAFMDDANKLGPSLHPLITLSVATALASQGESEAAGRWGGRLIPQTQFIKNAMALAGKYVPTGAGVNEFDPAVRIFANGQDPYEAKRVARELGIMQMEGLNPAAALDEAWTDEKGQLWQTATERAINRRAGDPWSFVANLIGGVGLKRRTQEDMQIDLFDAEWRRLWANKENLSPEQFQYELDNLRYKYPWGDTVLLARKSGLVRDRAYAYNVLGRIPPGLSTELLDLTGLAKEQINQFYENKGDLTKIPGLDREKFMLAVTNLGAVLDLPSWATRQEWNAVKGRYKDISEDIVRLYGADIEEKISRYYDNTLTTDQKNAYLEAHPEVGEALDYRQAMIMQDNLMPSYYASIDSAQRYYTSMMWDAINAQYPNIKDTWTAYDEAKLLGSKEQKKFKEAHPEMEAVQKIMTQYQKKIAQWMTSFAGLIKNVNPPARPVQPASVDQQRIQEFIGQPVNAGPYNMNAGELMGDMSPALQNLVVDYALNDEELSYAAELQLQDFADDLGIALETYKELLKQAILQSGLQP